MNNYLRSDADVARQIIEKLQKIEDWLAYIATKPEPEPLPGNAPPMPTPGTDAYWLMLCAMFASASLPASPAVTRTVVVRTRETPLLENESRNLLPVEITNDDVAQSIWVSSKGVMNTAGRVILPQATARYVLPKGTNLYGVCTVATVNVRVSEGHDIFGILTAGG